MRDPKILVTLFCPHVVVVLCVVVSDVRATLNGPTFKVPVAAGMQPHKLVVFDAPPIVPGPQLDLPVVTMLSVACSMLEGIFALCVIALVVRRTIGSIVPCVGSSHSRPYRPRAPSVTMGLSLRND